MIGDILAVVPFDGYVTIAEIAAKTGQAYGWVSTQCLNMTQAGILARKRVGYGYRYRRVVPKDLLGETDD